MQWECQETVRRPEGGGHNQGSTTQGDTIALNPQLALDLDSLNPKPPARSRP